MKKLRSQGQSNGGSALPSLSVVGLSLLGVLSISCGFGSSDRSAGAAAEASLPAEPGLVEVWAREEPMEGGKRYAFDGPGKIPFSGWVKLRFHNEGEEPHFLLIWDLPDGKTFEDYDTEVGAPFEDLYAKYRSGELEKGAFFEQLIAAIPEWFYAAIPMGGPGFTGAGRTSETTIYLEPGDNYIMECYVRARPQDDSFHGTHGMFRPLVVEGGPSGLEAPNADVEITLAGVDLSVEGDLSAGSHTARVSVLDTPEGFIRHNVHLARLEGDLSGADVAPWLDWVDAMVAPSPAAFVGGAGQTAGGRASYVTFNLEPGRYTWVSEGFGIQGMVHDFVVE